MTTSNQIIELQSQIIEILRNDNSKNNTIHFIWQMGLLKILTRNIHIGQIFLLKEFHAAEELGALRSALMYVRSTHKEEASYTVFWKDEDGNKHESYFRGSSGDDVIEKFRYHGNRSSISEIKENPIT